MPTSELLVHVARHREIAQLTQSELAELVGISRQALSNIEGGKSSPSTTTALRLAHALDCRVEDLFEVPADPTRPVAIVAGDAAFRGRVLAARVGERWIAHPLDGASLHDGADAVVSGGRLELLRAPELVARNVLLAGCAPILRLLVDRTFARHLQLRWLHTTSGQALELLRNRLVHVAGVHLYDPEADEFNLPQITHALAGRDLRVVTLARWEQGIATRADNPHGVASPLDLARDDLRAVSRPPGSGARQMIDRALGDAGLDPESIAGLPEAAGHLDAAWRVAIGAADVAPTIGAAARAHGLHFVGCTEERFDLILDCEALGPVADELVALLRDRSLVREIDALRDYDTSEMGRIVMGSA